jgi:hypothetical protein
MYSQVIKSFWREIEIGFDLPTLDSREVLQKLINGVAALDIID